MPSNKSHGTESLHWFTGRENIAQLKYNKKSLLQTRFLHLYSLTKNVAIPGQARAIKAKDNRNDDTYLLLSANKRIKIQRDWPNDFLGFSSPRRSSSSAGATRNTRRSARRYSTCSISLSLIPASHKLLISARSSAGTSSIPPVGGPLRHRSRSLTSS